MGRSFTRTVRITGTGNVLGVATPDWLGANVRGKLINTRLYCEGTSPATMTAALYVEDRVAHGRESTDNAYDATAVPTSPIVASATGLSLARSVATAGPYPAVPLSFGGGVAVKLNATNTGGAAWAVSVDLSVELDG